MHTLRGKCEDVPAVTVRIQVCGGQLTRLFVTCELHVHTIVLHHYMQ